MKINYKSPFSRLSILEYFSSLYPSDFLKDFYLIGCQHLLPSTLLMLRSCFDNGLKPEKTALIGKCYSISPTAQALMKDEGVYICPSSIQFDSHEPYDDQLQKNIFTFFKNAIDRLKIPPHAKLIVLDDGGELISIVNNLSSRFERVIGVEQTSAGYHKLANIQLKIPVINVARCSLKLRGESPAVSEAQVQQIMKSIDNLGLCLKRVLIVGNGALGKYLTLALRVHHEVICYDKTPRLSEIDKEDLDISTFDLIIGATGNPILSYGDVSRLKNDVVLASASSSDREFTASYFRKKIEKLNNCHVNLSIDGIHLLNCGFPVNFQGADEDSIPLEKIQLTIALMFSSMLQGVSDTNSRGFINLNYHQRSMLYQLSLNQDYLLQDKFEKPYLKSYS